MMRYLMSALSLVLAFSAAAATPLEVQQLSDNVYALVGEMEQRSDANLANNATFGVIVTDDGVVLVDPGGSYLGAEQIAETVKMISDRPVVLVINSGGQDHRWLGNGYFKQHGAKIIAAEAAVADHKARLQDEMFMLHNLLSEDTLKGTEPVYADETFGERNSLEIGGMHLELIHVGPAHTPADTLVWLPAQQIVFAGDVVYVERMLGVLPMSKSGHWLEAFETLADLQPKWVVPGHGHAVTLEKARADTYDYLVFLREAVAAMLDEGMGMERVGEIDQSRFSHLKVYEQIKGRNAQQVYSEMEWE
jgi:glyoxylase-like metal-dependent hydrolase (beta-lactamase superfamily II)